MRSTMSSLLRRSLRLPGIYPLASNKRQSHLFSSMVSTLPSSTTIISQIPSKSSPFLPFRFSSSAAASKKVGADQNLKRVLESEIQCSEESDSRDQAGPLPDGFPFELIDNPGEQTVILKREFAGESIQVEVHMPDMDGEEEEQDSEEDGDEDDDDKNSGPSSIYMIVTVVKGEGPRLEFCCTASPDEITIDSMLIKVPEGSQNPYDGPEFSDLDVDLQKAFHKYLEVRGIKSSLTSFLAEYMIIKDNREYLTWLKNMKEFVGK